MRRPARRWWLLSALITGVVEFGVDGLQLTRASAHQVKRKAIPGVAPGA